MKKYFLSALALHIFLAFLLLGNLYHLLQKKNEVGNVKVVTIFLPQNGLLAKRAEKKHGINKIVSQTTDVKKSNLKKIIPVVDKDTPAMSKNILETTDKNGDDSNKLLLLLHDLIHKRMLYQEEFLPHKISHPVTLIFNLLPSGDITDPQILLSSQNDFFDMAALKALTGIDKTEIVSTLRPETIEHLKIAVRFMK